MDVKERDRAEAVQPQTSITKLMQVVLIFWKNIGLRAISL